jgi:hypothetical protein
VGGTTTTESGEALFTRAKVTASRSLMLWGATGWRYESSPKTYTSTEGAELSGELPVTDQSGWRTEGNNIIDVSVLGSYTHTYTFKVSQFRKDAAGREIPVGEERTYTNVVLPTGDLSPVDLDTMLPVGTVAGGAVLVPDSWSTRLDALEAGGGGGDAFGEGVVPIFETLAQAEAWEADNTGVPALWLDGDGTLIQVTAAEPTWTDDATAGGGSWSTPTITGVTYSPASGTATAGQSVTVTATAQDGYQLSGTSTWTHTFPVAAATAVTATAPTRDDTANTYTIPTSTGVEYLVDGAVKAAGTYPVGDVDQTVSVTARALSGYALTGTSSWSLTFTKTPVVPIPSGAYGVEVLADSPQLYLPLDDAAGTTSPRVLGSLAAYNNSFAVGSGGATFGAPGLGDGASSVSLPGGATSMLYQAQVRFAKDASLNGATIGTTRACFQLLAQPTSSTAPLSVAYPILGGASAAVIHAKPDGTLRVTWGAATAESAAGVVNLGSRYLITGRWDGTTLTAYVNGSAVGTAPLASIAGDWKIVIGNIVSGTGYGPAGRFAGVAIWVGTTDASIPTPARILAYAQAAGLA